MDDNNIVLLYNIRDIFIIDNNSNYVLTTQYVTYHIKDKAITVTLMLKRSIVSKAAKELI